MISNYFIASSLTAIPSIVGAGIWAASNDIFTLVGIYDFHWFVSVTSLLVSVIAYIIHTFSFVFDVIQQRNLIYIHIVSVLLIGGLYTLFWFISAVNISVVVRQCNDIKHTYSHFLNDDLKSVYNPYNYSCDGEIVSMIFSYVNFIIWAFILFKSSKTWYRIYVFNNTTTINMQNLEHQFPLPQPQEQPQEQQQEPQEQQEQQEQPQEQPQEPQEPQT